MLPKPVAVRWRTGRQYRKYTAAYPLGRQRAHGLPGGLIVSLTSFPARYATLHLTLQSLLRQDMPADRVVLWIAHGDADALPPAVRQLFDRGVELRKVDDVRSYKKLVFALDAFPDAHIATADDDVFYTPDWLGQLVDGLHAHDRVIPCHRAHRLTEARGGGLANYAEWGWDVQDDAARAPSGDLMPTGIGGILYPPGVLHADATRRDLYERYAPTADDLWFFWCARRAGARYRKVGGRFKQLGWWSAQESRLFDENVVRNDAQVRALVHRYGEPQRMPLGGASAPQRAAS